MNTSRTLPWVVAASALTLGVVAPAASAQDSSDSAVGTVQVSDEIRSVTVSPETFEFDRCSRAGVEGETDGLTFPNGVCQATQGITITNGDTAAHIHVDASSFEGSDGGQSWALVHGGQNPGQDEFSLLLVSEHADGPRATEPFGCDGNWSADSNPDEQCAAEPGQSVTEVATFFGPSASTNTSPSFSTTITWTAMP